MTYFSTINPISQRYSRPLTPERKKAAATHQTGMNKAESAPTFKGKESPKEPPKTSIPSIRISKNIGLPMVVINNEDRLILYKMLKDARNSRKAAATAINSNHAGKSGKKGLASSPNTPHSLEPEDDYFSPQQLTKTKSSQVSLAKLSPGVRKTLLDNPKMLDDLLRSLEDLYQNGFNPEGSKSTSPTSTPFSRNLSHTHLSPASPDSKQKWAFVRRDLGTHSVEQSAIQTPSYAASRNGWMIIEEEDANGESDID